MPELTYIKCDDQQIVQEVEQGIKTFIGAIECPGRQIIHLIFYEKHDKRGGWLHPFSVSKTEREWERWSISVTCRSIQNSTEKEAFEEMQEKNLTGCLLYIASQGAIPPTHWLEEDEDHPSWPYFRIAIPGTTTTESWGGLLKKMISDSSIPGLLG